ncbi:MAG: phospholipase D-like domain-containing protein [Actinomycetota bacterium]|nr:phospholipase D-like domain-containing protein [Actinomycetota bacterium]
MAAKDRREDWFLAPHERGNPDSDIDRRRADGRAYTEGNLAIPRIHGATYFARLLEVILELGEGDWIHFTDWRGDADERLDGPGTEIVKVLADAARRGVEVRGLVWRSHPDQTKFSEQESLHFAKTINRSGGEVLLDERVRQGGSHHQKLFLIRHPGDENQDIAFVGGIDLCHSRRDDERHEGDPQAWDMNETYGPTPAWHDIQLELKGPAIGDLAHTFRERWDDPTPLDHQNPWRIAMARRAGQPRHPDPLPDMPEDPDPAGPHAVQVLRTYPKKTRQRYPFAREGERSIARAYLKALKRARRLIYVEDQYFWSEEVAASLGEALKEQPTLHLIALLPLMPEQEGVVSETPERLGQKKAWDVVRKAGGERVALYGVENDAGRPIYIHAKACVMDDVWAMIGSDNLNRRSWTHDSELSCAVLDDTRDGREPRDPAGLGDEARRYARDLRLTLWREHLGVSADDFDLLDPRSAYDAWSAAADRLEEWKKSGKQGPRPSRVVRHEPPDVPRGHRVWAEPAYRYLVDPDGRPRRLRKRGEF